MRALIATIVAAVVCSQAQATPADRWEQVSKAVDGTVVKIDRETIRRDGDSVIAWVEYRHGDTKPYIDYKYAARTMQRQRVSCMSMTSAIEFYTQYDDKGHVLSSGEGAIRHPSPIIPDSLGEATWQYLCRP